MHEDFLARVKFDERGLVPAVARDVVSGVVLMLAWQNREALRRTLATGEAYYFSRSRGCLWKKGETSGHVQKVRGVWLDCDGDSILLLVEQTGPACHTQHPTCFFFTPEGERDQPPVAASILDDLHRVIEARRDADTAKSYVKSLFEKGPEAIFAKVTEEASELIDASRRELPHKDLVHEAADLWFHSLVLLARHGVTPTAVFEELRRRFGRSGLEEKALRARSQPSRVGEA